MPVALDRYLIGVLGAVSIVGVGCTGGGPSAGAVCSARASTGQLDAEAVGGLVVAPDESHVAFVRDPRTWESGCPARASRHTAGTLVALSLLPDGSSCERVVAHDVPIYSVSFSSDSRGMVFTDGIDDCGVGNLKTAAADGANVRLVHDAVGEHAAIGSMVFFTSPDEQDLLATPIVAGKGRPVSLGVRSDFGEVVAETNPTGTAVAFRSYQDGLHGPDGSLALVQLPSGESRTVSDGTREYAGRRSWSSRGEWLAFLHMQTPTPACGANVSLALVAADGTARTEVSANSGCNVLAFAPDDSWLAYDEPDGAGGSRLMTYSLKDGRKVALGVLPAGYAVVSFSDDGVDVVASVDTPTSVNTSIYGATAGVPGSLQLLTDAVAFPERVTVGGHHVAIAIAPATVEVYPVSGGAPVVLDGLNAQFETGVSEPHLLMWQSQLNTVGVASADGSGAAFQTVPDVISFASWLGTTAVYGTAPAGSDAPTTITSLTDTGTVSAQLAAGAGAYGWAPVPAPTRLFYSRAAPNPDGPVGLWMVDLPR